jgi:hypothetical protein
MTRNGQDFTKQDANQGLVSKTLIIFRADVPRLGFAHGILNDIPLVALTIFDLHFDYSEPRNHGWKPHSLLANQNAPDSLSQALRKVSQAPNLRFFRINFDAVISPEMFWPQVDVSNNSFETLKKDPPNEFWPSLEEFQIRPSAILPDGTWMFSGVPGSPSLRIDDNPPRWPKWFREKYGSDGEPEDMSDYDSDNSNNPNRCPALYEKQETGRNPQWEYRRAVKEDMFETWIRSMGHATQLMPKLKTGTLCLEPRGRIVGDFWSCFVDVECRASNAGGREWEFQIGDSMEFCPSAGLYRFLEERTGSVGLVHVSRAQVPTLRDKATILPNLEH